MVDSSTPSNLIKVSTQSRVNYIMRFANVLLKERNFREIHFRALGASIGKLVSVVELLKLTTPGLYQVTTIGTVAFQQKETETSQTSNERLYPKLEITLTLDEPKEKGIGFQTKWNEEERKRFLEINEKQRNRTFEERGGQGRGGFRGGNRGGFRGGNRGGPRGGSRGGPIGGNRGGFRGQNRGGNRPQQRFNDESFNQGQGYGRRQVQKGGYNEDSFQGSSFQGRQQGRFNDNSFQGPQRGRGGFGGRGRGGFGGPSRGGRGGNFQARRPTGRGYN